MDGHIMTLEEHPAFRILLERYRAARLRWAAYPSVRAAAAWMKMDEREYCNRYVSLNFGPLTWAGTGESPALASEHFDRAFALAAVPEGE